MQKWCPVNSWNVNRSKSKPSLSETRQIRSFKTKTLILEEWWCDAQRTERIITLAVICLCIQFDYCEKKKTKLRHTLTVGNREYIQHSSVRNHEKMNKWNFTVHKREELMGWHDRFHYTVPCVCSSVVWVSTLRRLVLVTSLLLSVVFPFQTQY